MNFQLWYKINKTSGWELLFRERHSQLTDYSKDIPDLYQRQADYFDGARRSPTADYVPFEKPWFDDFLDVVRKSTALNADKPTLNESGRLHILDMGCGGGDPIAKYMIGAGAAITGVDTSPRLIELCCQRFPGHQWINADMRTFHASRQYQGLIAWDSFFHLTPDDQRSFLQRVPEMLVLGGAFMFTSGYEDGVRMGTMNTDPLYHASLTAREYDEILQRVGFEIVRYKEDDPECGLHTIRLCKLIR